jgi:hypothetical protein
MSAQSTSLPTRADVRDGPSADTVRAVDYEGDLVAWAEANARLLRLGRLEEVDAEHIAEELEDMGKSERRALGSHLQNLVMHLLKWQYQPQRRRRSWRFSVLNARASYRARLSLDRVSMQRKHEVHPACHAQQDLAHDVDVVEVLRVDGRLAVGAAG